MSRISSLINLVVLCVTRNIPLDWSQPHKSFGRIGDCGNLAKSRPSCSCLSVDILSRAFRWAENLGDLLPCIGVHRSICELSWTPTQ